MPGRGDRETRRGGEPGTLNVQHQLFTMLPMPPFTADETQAVARQVYDFVWQQSSHGWFGSRLMA